jgi:hypothetical protein
MISEVVRKKRKLVFCSLWIFLRKWWQFQFPYIVRYMHIEIYKATESRVLPCLRVWRHLVRTSWRHEIFWPVCLRRPDRSWPWSQEPSIHQTATDKQQRKVKLSGNREERKKRKWKLLQRTRRDSKLEIASANQHTVRWSFRTLIMVAMAPFT